MGAGFALFNTVIGLCGLAWNGSGLISVQLPEVDAAASRRRFLQRFPDLTETPPTGPNAHAVAQICSLISTGKTDLADLPLDMSGQSELYQRIYQVARTIKPGATLTYGEIAARLGTPREARAIGQAMGRNPWPIVVPCHRVLGVGGKLVGFSAHGGLETKLRLLAIEHAKVGDAPGLFDDQGGLPIGTRPPAPSALC